MHRKKSMALSSNPYFSSLKSGNKFKPTPTVLYQRGVYETNLSSATESLIGHRIAHSQSLYKRDLLGHFGCVNAIEFSSNGDYIASGGDDRRLLLWNVGRVIFDSKEPDVITTQHFSNINTCCFDNTNQTVATGGNDGQILFHDFGSMKQTSCHVLSDAVYCLSSDPINSNIIAAASDDGKVNIIDTRISTENSPFVLAACGSPMHSVMYNPIEPRILATANAKSGVGLWDVRWPKKNLAAKNSDSNCMSVRFNKRGDQLLVLRRRSAPVLMDVASTEILYQFDYTAYYNACTLKSCCFGGLNDEYIVSGSDDFCIYLWRIPLGPNECFNQESPHMILKGHRSIVNQVRYCPVNQIFISSGVEKLIKMWSPYNIPGSTGRLVHNRRYGDDDEPERNAYSHEEYIHMVLMSDNFLSHDYTNGNTEEEPCMIAFFDSLIQREVAMDEYSSDSAVDDNDSVHSNDNEERTTGMPQPEHGSSSNGTLPLRSQSPTLSESSSSGSDSEMDETILRSIYNRYISARTIVANVTQPSGCKISSIIAKGKQRDKTPFKTLSQKIRILKKKIQQDHTEENLDRLLLGEIIDNVVENRTESNVSANQMLNNVNTTNAADSNLANSNSDSSVSNESEIGSPHKSVVTHTDSLSKCSTSANTRVKNSDCTESLSVKVCDSTDVVDCKQTFKDTISDPAGCSSSGTSTLGVSRFRLDNNREKKNGFRKSKLHSDKPETDLCVEEDSKVMNCEKSAKESHSVTFKKASKAKKRSFRTVSHYENDSSSDNDR